MFVVFTVASVYPLEGERVDCEAGYIKTIFTFDYLTQTQVSILVHAKILKLDSCMLCISIFFLVLCIIQIWTFQNGKFQSTL